MNDNSKAVEWCVKHGWISFPTAEQQAMDTRMANAYLHKNQSAAARARQEWNKAHPESPMERVFRVPVRRADFPEGPEGFHQYDLAYRKAWHKAVRSGAPDPRFACGGTTTTDS